MKKHARNGVLWAVAAAYCVFVLWMVLRPESLFRPDFMPRRSIEIAPFDTISGYLGGTYHVSLSVVVFNLLGNIVVFMPLGLYACLLFKDKRVMPNTLRVFLCSLFIEVAQFALGVGVSDVDDLLLNTVGGLLGALTYKLLRRVCGEEDRVRTVAMVLSLVVGVPFFTLTGMLFFANRH